MKMLFYCRVVIQAVIPDRDNKAAIIQTKVVFQEDSKVVILVDNKEVIQDNNHRYEKLLPKKGNDFKTNHIYILAWLWHSRRLSTGSWWIRSTNRRKLCSSTGKHSRSITRNTTTVRYGR